MTHKLSAKMMREDPSKKEWHSISCISNAYVEVGDSLVISEDLSEYRDELIVGPSNGVCGPGCWAYCHLTWSACEYILKCNHKHPRLCLVHIEEVLEDL